MNSVEESILAIAEIMRDTGAMNDAALAGDFDEARFLAQLVVTKAEAAGQADLALAAVYVVDRLGPPGTVPQSGYGAGMLLVADELGKIRLDPS